MAAAQQKSAAGDAPAEERGTKARIERAALDLFVANGVDAATTREIAKAAGVSEGAIYRHFDSKDALAAAMFLSIHEKLAALVRAAARDKQGIADQTAAVVNAYCRTADADFPLFTFHLLYTHRFLPTPEGVDDPVTAVEDIIAAAVKRREIAKAAPALVAGMALGVVLQTALQIHYGRLEGPLSRHAGDLAAAALAVMQPTAD
ncbi:MAG: TetR/AcrR family transcriptional regulator [Parvularculaceae bacterium]|nr:TetR/AcrR family transcriptional regulator [Parvularculaceae bacterium]